MPALDMCLHVLVWCDSDAQSWRAESFQPIGCTGSARLLGVLAPFFLETVPWQMPLFSKIAEHLLRKTTIKWIELMTGKWLWGAGRLDSPDRR